MGKLVARDWSPEILAEHADRWIVSTDPKRYIKLLTKEEFKKLKKGTAVIGANGKSFSKDVDTPSVEESVWIFGRMPFGLETFGEASEKPVKKGKKK